MLSGQGVLPWPFFYGLRLSSKRFYGFTLILLLRSNLKSIFFSKKYREFSWAVRPKRYRILAKRCIRLLRMFLVLVFVTAKNKHQKLWSFVFVSPVKHLKRNIYSYTLPSIDQSETTFPIFFSIFWIKLTPNLELSYTTIVGQNMLFIFLTTLQTKLLWKIQCLY